MRFCCRWRARISGLVNNHSNIIHNPLRGVAFPTNSSRMESVINGSHGDMSLASLLPSRSGLSTGFSQSCVPITCTFPSSRKSGIVSIDSLPYRSQLGLLPDRIYMSWLCVGISSSYTSYYAIALFSQWYLRTRYPRWFAKYNYILGAGEFVYISVPHDHAEKASCSA